jgi:hypothetical protein
MDGHPANPTRNTSRSDPLAIATRGSRAAHLHFAVDEEAGAGSLFQFAWSAMPKSQRADQLASHLADRILKTRRRCVAFSGEQHDIKQIRGIEL